jgi:hypothetical protein
MVDGATWLHAHLTHREIASFAGDDPLREDEGRSLVLLDIDRLASGT